jgi:pimeloyl-ACP methyl ester carboxylesterase
MMTRLARLSVLASLVTFTLPGAEDALHAQRGLGQPTQTSAASPIKRTFVPLGNNANALIAEPATSDPVRGRIAILVAHPDNANQFNSFIAQELVTRGYRAMMLNYYGPELTYEEFIAPIAAAMRALRSTPGIEKVIFVGHSTGGPELTSYQDVAENGPKACQGPERIYPCRGKNLENLPKADGIVLLDSHSGAPERMISLDPAVDSRRPRERNPELDMFSPHVGFDPKTNSATYSAEFTKKFLAAQSARNNRVIDEALARLAMIEKGEGAYKDDEPFVIPGWSTDVNGGRLELADRRFMSRTHAPHLHLKGDGTTPTEIVTSTRPVLASVDNLARLDVTTQNVTVRHYLSFIAIRTTAEYGYSENGITGITWRSTTDSIQGNLQGITVPTLVVSATCAPHLDFLEAAYDRSASKDKAFVGIEGANHGFQPCKPEYGDVRKRAFDYVDGWLRKAGRF